MLHEECTKSDKIDSIAESVKRMERGQEQLIELLQKVASQDARLDHLEDHAEKTVNDVNEVFGRVRDLELNQAAYGPEARLQFNNLFDEVSHKMDDVNQRIEKVQAFIRMLTSKPAYYTYGVILFLVTMGAFSDYEFHREWFKNIVAFFK